jgi:hypothetical protein
VVALVLVLVVLV